MSIVTENYTKSFNGKTFALKDVNLKIDQGEFVAIIGLSGAGKSTFLRAVNGMNAAGEGKMEVLGRNVPELRGRALKGLRREIGFIFQQFNLVKSISVLQNVLMGRLSYNPYWRVILGIFSDEDKLRAKLALDAVGLNGRYHDRAANLSGGQQQRVAIARALVQEPKIILADEPMASLDPKLSEVVLDILQEINRSRKITVIVNIHVLSLAKRYADRIIAFRGGEVYFDGKPDALTNDLIEKIYHVDKRKLEEL